MRQPYSVTISIPGLPKGLNGSHGHFSIVAKNRRVWRRSTAYAAIALGRPAAPLKKCRIVCTRFSSIPMDEDNIAGSFKPLIDGLKDAGIISDDKKECVVHREYRWAKAPQGEGRVQISILELQETNGGEDQCGS